MQFYAAWSLLYHNRCYRHNGTPYFPIAADSYSLEVAIFKKEWVTVQTNKWAHVRTYIHTRTRTHTEMYMQTDEKRYMFTESLSCNSRHIQNRKTLDIRVLIDLYSTKTCPHSSHTRTHTHACIYTNSHGHSSGTRQSYFSASIYFPGLNNLFYLKPSMNGVAIWNPLEIIPHLM